MLTYRCNRNSLLGFRPDERTDAQKELVESPAYSISAGDRAASVTVQTLLDNPPPDGTIAYAKWLTDGQSVELSGKVVSAGSNWFSGRIYIQELGRSCGIRINTSGSFASGDVVSVSGTMGTASGERIILNAIVEKTDTTDAPAPLTLNNRATGGGPFMYDEGPPERGQKGVHGNRPFTFVNHMVKP